MTSSKGSIDTINIRPGVSILSVLPHLNYKPWFAMAEFVDNSLQSFQDSRSGLEAVEGVGCVLTVSITIDTTDGGRITIRDNAAGIAELDYPRAFRPAELPPDRSGLSEFGMGMKSAACWFASQWRVRTSALGEAVERTVRLDIDKIVRDELEELDVHARVVPADYHYTEIILTELHKPLHGRTIGKIKTHLASIYRIFIREGILILKFNDEVLSYSDTPVLVAPYYKSPSSEPIVWKKEVHLDFGMGQLVTGFAALRAKASSSEAGFALFRRNRLIMGSGDEAYRPEYVFGKPNSFTFQRLFGELHLQGFDVSHTKDGFRWEEHEDIFLEMLRSDLDGEEMPLLSQAEGHRVRPRPEDLMPGVEIASKRTADNIKREVPSVLQGQLGSEPDSSEPPSELPSAELVSQRVIDVELEDARWEVILELSNDPEVGEWVELCQRLLSDSEAHERDVRRVGIRVALCHPFMERFGGTDPSRIEPLLRIAVAIVLAEITAREGGVKQAGAIRRNVNELLRDALSKP